MARIELWTSVFAGLSGGLAGALWSSLLASGGLVPGPGAGDAGHDRREPATRLVLGSAIRAVAGAALGLLFWLGWGLIALVGLPWYGAGVLFAALCWVALVAPALATLALRRPGLATFAAAHAADWLVTCLAIGLLCAYAWHRYA